MSDNIRTIYAGKNLRVPFDCYEADGVTPLDLSPPGRVEFSLKREGMVAFTVEVNSEEPGAVEWTSRVAGKGVLRVPLAEVDLPAGLCKLLFTAVDKNGVTTIQDLEWVRIVATDLAA